MAFFCQYCGFPLPVSAYFCSQCGASVTAAQPMPGRPLVRPRFGRQIGGVCEALAQAHGWDVTAVRILAVVGLIFSSGLVGIGYLAAWIGIPEETTSFPAGYSPGVWTDSTKQ